MSIISVSSLCKEFRTPKSKKGVLGSLKGLFYREYETRTALDHLSFEIEEGELVGYIGPNGAGKSTTVKILSGIMAPTSGTVSVMGRTPWEHRIETVRHLGVVFGQRTQLWWDLPVVESFDLLKAIYHVPDAEYETTLDRLIGMMDIAKLLSVPARHLSLGQRMRCDMVASLLHSPKILFLDEPTIGLDAVSKLAVRDFIRHLNQERRVTIILTTHDMDDIESLCNRVLVLNEGQIFLDGTLAALREQISTERRLIVDLMSESDTISDPEATLVRQEGHRVYLQFDPMKSSPPELIARIIARHAIRDMYVENLPIEEIVAKLYRRAGA
jgi:ABC-2 type transport system ATP-binding protein